MTTNTRRAEIRGTTAAPTSADTDRLLRLPEVVRVVGLKRSSIYGGVSKGTFPPPVRVTTRAVAWSERAVLAWIDACKTEGWTSTVQGNANKRQPSDSARGVRK